MPSRVRRSPRARFWSSAWPARARRRPACSPARGERVIGVDSGSPEGAAGLAGCRRRSHPGWGRSRERRGGALRGQEPRGPGERAGDRRGPRAGPAGDRRARALLAPAPEPLLRGHRHQRKDHGRRAARPHLAHRRRAGRGRRQRRHAARLAGRRDRRRGDDRLRGVELPARGRRRASPPSAGCCSTSPPTTSIATAPSTPTGTAKLRMFANQGEDDVCVYNGSDPALAGVEIPAAAERASSTSADAESASYASSRCPAPTTPRTPPRRRSPRRRWGSTTRRSRAGLASFRGVPHRLERVAEIDGVLLRQRLEGHQRRRGDRGAALVRRRRARDPRRLAQGRRLRRARASRSPSAARPPT